MHFVHGIQNSFEKIQIQKTIKGVESGINPYTSSCCGLFTHPISVRQLLTEIFKKMENIQISESGHNNLTSTSYARSKVAKQTKQLCESPRSVEISGFNHFLSNVCESNRFLSYFHNCTMDSTIFDGPSFYCHRRISNELMEPIQLENIAIAVKRRNQ